MRCLSKIIMVLLLGIAPWVTAEEGVFLDLSFPAETAPKEVYFLIEAPQGMMVLAQGLHVPVLAAPGVSRRWRAGALVNDPRLTTPIRFYALIVGGDNKYTLYPEKGPMVLNKDALRAPTELREHLLQRKEVLKSWQMQIQIQEDSLSRLRADAEVIGSLGKIVEVQDEIEKTKKSVNDIEGDMENLQFFLKASRSTEIPINYAAREGQLTRQIAELADAVRYAESTELKRSSYTQADIQAKLALVESARGEDYDLLQRELVKLRAQRLALEKSPPPTAATIDMLE